MSVPTKESREALSRSWFFLDKADSCAGEDQVEFEACLEAAIVFARAALHRIQNQFKKHPKWRHWWDSLETDSAVLFFRRERNWILKNASPRVGQVVFLGTAGGDAPPYRPAFAREHYYFQNGKTATETVREYLVVLERHLVEARKLFT